jgi:hypothetical protein
LEGVAIGHHDVEVMDQTILLIFNHMNSGINCSDNIINFIHFIAGDQ